MAEPILSNAEYQRLNTGLGRIQSQMDILNKAEAAGLDMTEPKALLEAQKFQIEQIKKQFFAERP